MGPKKKISKPKLKQTQRQKQNQGIVINIDNSKKTKTIRRDPQPKLPQPTAPLIISPPIIQQPIQRPPPVTTTPAPTTNNNNNNNNNNNLELINNILDKFQNNNNKNIENQLTSFKTELNNSLVNASSNINSALRDNSVGLIDYINQGNYDLAKGIIYSNNNIIKNTETRFNEFGNKINNVTEKLNYFQQPNKSSIHEVDSSTEAKSYVKILPNYNLLNSIFVSSKPAKVNPVIDSDNLDNIENLYDENKTYPLAIYGVNEMRDDTHKTPKLTPKNDYAVPKLKREVDSSTEAKSYVKILPTPTKQPEPLQQPTVEDVEEDEDTGEVIPPPTEEMLKYWTCPYCDQVFVSDKKSNVSKHMKTHISNDGVQGVKKSRGGKVVYVYPQNDVLEAIHNLKPEYKTKNTNTYDI